MKSRKAGLRGPIVSPETAMWTLYTDLCSGLRWQRHAVKVAAETARFTAPRTRDRDDRR